MHLVTNLGVQFVPLADVARQFNVLSTTLLRELQRARVATICIGNQHQVNVDELNAWLKAKHDAAKEQLGTDTGGEVGS
jgi:hypothetical protein